MERTLGSKQLEVADNLEFQGCINASERYLTRRVSSELKVHSRFVRQNVLTRT